MSLPLSLRRPEAGGEGLLCAFFFRHSQIHTVEGGASRQAREGRRDAVLVQSVRPSVRPSFVRPSAETPRSRPAKQRRTNSTRSLFDVGHPSMQARARPFASLPHRTAEKDSSARSPCCAVRTNGNRVRLTRDSSVPPSCRPAKGGKERSRSSFLPLLLSGRPAKEAGPEQPIKPGTGCPSKCSLPHYSPPSSFFSGRQNYCAAKL